MPLLEYPAYLINVDSKPDRLEYATTNLTKAGFTDVRRFRAVEPSTAESNSIDTVSFVDKFHSPRNCCSLSHLNVWKRILEEGHDRAVVCEDDIYFVNDWDTLHREYYTDTPRDYDFIYIGAGICGINGTTDKIIKNQPTVCMHCYVITKDFIEDFFSRSHSSIIILDMYLRDLTITADRTIYTWSNTHKNTNVDVSDRYKKMSTNLKFSGLALQDEEYHTSLNTLDNFISNYTGYIEGHTRQVPEYIPELRKVFTDIPHPKNILEIGFNIGCSSDSFLSMFKHGRVTSVDLGEHAYVTGAKRVIDGNYFHRHKLILGDSTVVIPLIDSSKSFDFIFIDGGHFGDIPDIDLRNCKRLAHGDTIVIMSDTVISPDLVADHTIAPTRAWKDAITNGLVRELGSVEFCHGRGFSWGKYCM